MAIFLSAGHTPLGIKRDPGAVANNLKECELTKEQRDLTVHELNVLGVKSIIDKDDESLLEYLKRIKTGSGSVVLEFHFDAFNGQASGSTSIVGNDADRLDKAFAKELVTFTAKTLNIVNRGVKTESESHRGKLGLMRKKGIVSLLEICFIDNQKDIDKWQLNKNELAKGYSLILKKYEDML